LSAPVKERAEEESVQVVQDAEPVPTGKSISSRESVELVFDVVAEDVEEVGEEVEELEAADATASCVANGELEATA